MYREIEKDELDYERKEFEKEIREQVQKIRIQEFHQLRKSMDYDVTDAICKTLDYVLVLLDMDLYFNDIKQLLRTWSELSDSKRLMILESMEKSFNRLNKKD